jgi:hypothetical protein
MTLPEMAALLRVPVQPDPGGHAIGNPDEITRWSLMAARLVMARKGRSRPSSRTLRLGARERTCWIGYGCSPRQDADLSTHAA